MPWNLIYNANSAISHPQLLLSRSEAYLNLQRFTHARCDIYTVIVNNPTTATLRDCYDVLRELYLVENKSSEVADEKLALHLKMTLPDLFKCFVETGIAHDVEVPKMEGFLKRHYRKLILCKAYPNQSC